MPYFMVTDRGIYVCIVKMKYLKLNCQAPVPASVDWIGRWRCCPPMPQALVQWHPNLPGLEIDREIVRLLTRHVTGSYAEAMEIMGIILLLLNSRGRRGRSRLSRDVCNVKKIVNVLEHLYQNSFFFTWKPLQLYWSTLSLEEWHPKKWRIVWHYWLMFASQRWQFAKGRLVQENKASLQELQERTVTKTSADMWEPLPADRQKGLLYCNAGVLFWPMLSVPKTQDIDIKTILNHKMHGCHLTSVFLFFFF